MPIFKWAKDYGIGATAGWVLRFLLFSVMFCAVSLLVLGLAGSIGAIVADGLLGTDLEARVIPTLTSPAGLLALFCFGAANAAMDTADYTPPLKDVS